MVPLKENGELDIERINELPIMEYMEVMGDLTEEQFNEYLSKSPVDESMEPVRAISIDCPIEEIGVDAEIVIDNLRRKYMKK